MYKILVPLLFLTILASCGQEPTEKADGDNASQQNEPVVTQKVETATPTTPQTEPKSAQPAQPTKSSASPYITQDLTTISKGEEVSFSAPDGQEYTYTITDQEKSMSGNVTVTALIDGCEDCSMTFVAGDSGGFGRIRTPDTIYQLSIKNGTTTILDLKDPNMKVDPQSANDMVAPPQPEKAANTETSSATEPKQPSAAAFGEQMTATHTIDVMVVYTPGLAAKYPGDLLSTRIDYLIALSNISYNNSNIDIALRLVHTQEFNYSDDATNGTALTDITNHNTVFADIETLRTDHGADLVALLRPYAYPLHSGCGMAWVLGSNESFSSWDANYGFSVVSDGDDRNGSNYYCSDLTFPHELGHNMGTTHDRDHVDHTKAQPDPYPAYPYGYGYGINNEFGTVMSYYNPGIERFSNPDQVACSTSSGLVACGVDENAANSSNNTLALNNAAASIAAFRSTKHAADLNNDGNVDTKDTLKALRVSAGIDSTQVDILEDIDGDGKIGIEEAIHSLKQL